MVDLVLRPSKLVDGKPFALQLRWHDSLGETEYYTLASVSEGLAEDIVRAGAPYWMFGEPAESGKDLKAEITTLRAALSAAEAEIARLTSELEEIAIPAAIIADRARREAREWQTIDTAPKDGTRFLAAEQEGGWIIGVCMWCKTPHVSLYGFHFTDGDPEDWEISHPSYWMPLPASPATDSKGEKPS